MSVNLIEEYIEFDGSKVFLYRANDEGFFRRYKWFLYIKNKLEVSGWAITKRQAKNDALTWVLDKEWENLPPKVKERNERKIRKPMRS